MTKKNERILLIAGGLALGLFYFLSLLKPELFLSGGNRKDLLGVLSYLNKIKFTVPFLISSVVLAILAGLILLKSDYFIRRYRQFFLLILGAGFFSALMYAIFHAYTVDEREHIHTTWKILNGASPYVDFFQHHHPFFWLHNLPIFALFGASPATMISARILNFLFLTGIVAGTYQIGGLLKFSWEQRLLSVLLLLTFQMFLISAVELRPDVPQSFFCLYSFYFFLRFLREKQLTNLVYSGICVAIAFLYLQKALLFLFPLGLIMIFLWFRKRMSIGHITLFTISVCIPVILFLSYYLLRDQIEEYLLFNWVINFHKETAAQTWKYYMEFIFWNPFFLWLMLTSGLHFLMQPTKIPRELWMCFTIGGTIFVLASITPQPWHQYYLPAWPFFALCMVYSADILIRKLRKNLRLVLYLGMLVSIVLVQREEMYNMHANAALYESVQYNRAHYKPSDTAFDNSIRLNLFQSDLHFFWFSRSNYGHYVEIANTPEYRWLIKKRYDDYNFCQLVEKHRPKWIRISPTAPHRQLTDCPSLLPSYRNESNNVFQLKE